jgi:hypothetical protein
MASVMYAVPFAGTALHGLTAELAACSGPLATRAGFWAVFGGRVASNLLDVSDTHTWAGGLSAPSSADTRRRLARL